MLVTIIRPLTVTSQQIDYRTKSNLQAGSGMEDKTYQLAIARVRHSERDGLKTQGLKMGDQKR